MEDIILGGTKIGGLKAADANKKNDPDFYSKIGRIGGKASKTGGFYVNRELARKVGKIGGKISKRGKAKKRVTIEVKQI